MIPAVHRLITSCTPDEHTRACDLGRSVCEYRVDEAEGFETWDSSDEGAAFIGVVFSVVAVVVAAAVVVGWVAGKRWGA